MDKTVVNHKPTAIGFFSLESQTFYPLRDDENIVAKFNTLTKLVGLVTLVGVFEYDDEYLLAKERARKGK